jgi:hypothetical protein
MLAPDKVRPAPQPHAAINDYGITDETARWGRVLLRKTLGQDWRPVVRELDAAELTEWAFYIEQWTKGPQERLLNDLGLPQLEGPGFWDGEVLPYLRKLLAPPVGRFPDHDNIFSNAKGAVDIVDLAEQYIDLRDAGPGKLKGLCPLHTERTPSFVVFRNDQRWHCFGACGAGGDAIELTRRLMEQGKW